MPRTRSNIAPRIVHAARARFLREGVDGASLRAIADDAGTSIGMVYYYFTTKDDLFFAVVEETYERLLADMTRALDPTLEPVERMRRLYRRVGAIDDHEAQIVRLVIREVLVSSRRLDRLLRRFQRGHFPIVLKTIADGMATGTIRDDVPPMLVLVVAIAVGAIPQFVLQHVAPKLRGPLADQLIELLWRGIGPTQPSTRRPRARRSAR
jgi:AcrR family transcriptional regulator